jgi:hypothetical protein
MHQLGPRPRSFFGPEDWDGVTPPEELGTEIKQRQQVWDASFRALPWWRRALISAYTKG